MDTEGGGGLISVILIYAPALGTLLSDAATTSILHFASTTASLQANSINVASSLVNVAPHRSEVSTHTITQCSRSHTGQSALKAGHPKQRARQKLHRSSDNNNNKNNNNRNNYPINIVTDILSNMQRRQRQRRHQQRLLSNFNVRCVLFYFFASFFSSLLFFKFEYHRRSDSQVVFKLIAFCGMSVPATSPSLSLSPSLRQLSFISHVAGLCAARLGDAEATAEAAAEAEAVKSVLHPTEKGVAANGDDYVNDDYEDVPFVLISLQFTAVLPAHFVWLVKYLIYTLTYVLSGLYVHMYFGLNVSRMLAIPKMLDQF